MKNYILSATLVFATLVYAWFNRYEIITTSRASGVYIIKHDNLTGKTYFQFGDNWKLFDTYEEDKK